MAKTKTKEIRISISPEKYEMIEKYAKKFDSTKAEFCRQAVMERIFKLHNLDAGKEKEGFAEP